MTKVKSEQTRTKTIKKQVKKAFRPKNIGNVLILLATLALLATSILPYLF